MVGAEGFEPPASCSQSRRATRLRYAPNCSLLHDLEPYSNEKTIKFKKTSLLFSIWQKFSFLYKVTISKTQ